MEKRRGIQILNAPVTELPDPKRQIDTLWLPRRTSSGVRVTPETALEFSPVWSAVRVISETVASLGWKVFEKKDGGGKTEITETPTAKVLKNPCPEMTPFTFRETVTAWCLLWGNGYAEIERDLIGRPMWLWPISPDRMEITRDTGNNLIYVVHNDDGSVTPIPASDMFHLKGMGTGLVGYSVIGFAARSIGLGIAAEEFGSNFFGNGASLGGVLKYPNKLDDDARKNLRDSWANMYSGPYNTGKTAILEQGLEYHQIGIPPDDAQFLETRKFQISDVARWFRVPPHKLADLERATFSNIEEQNIDFTTDTIVPWAMRWEQEGDRKLLGRQNRVKQYTKLNLNSLLRGALDKRYDAYTKGRQWGWLSANDVREFEDLDPLPADQGDVYLSPTNMTPTEKLGEEPEPVVQQFQQPGGEDEDQEEGQQPNPDMMRNIYISLINDSMKRCLSRESNHAKRAPKKITTSQEFRDHMAAFYVKHEKYVVDALVPIAESMSAFAGVDSKDENVIGHFNSVLFGIAKKHCIDSCDELVDAFDDGNLKSFYTMAEDVWPLEIANDIFKDFALTIARVK